MRVSKTVVFMAMFLFVVPSVAIAGSRLALLPVVVHSSGNEAGYVSDGLSDMLTARIEQLGQIEVVRHDAPSDATTDLAVALAKGRESSADFVLFGSFTQFGDGASLDLQCAPVAGGRDARHIFIQSGTMGEIIPKLDELADKLERYVAGGGSAASVARIRGGTAGNAAATDETLNELRSRLELLEQAVFPPVAGASEGAEDGDSVAQSPGS